MQRQSIAVIHAKTTIHPFTPHLPIDVLHNPAYSIMAADTASAPADTGVIAYAQSSLDRIMPPASRQQAYDSTCSFAQSRPVLFSFLATQLLFALLPLLLFASFAASTVAFALGAALVFSLFWIGVAFMVLVPSLLLTASVAVLAWAWAVGGFVVARWLYERLSGAGAGAGADGEAAKKPTPVLKIEDRN
ncbi:hypothetical protein B0I35DRAFT_440236 [Stachybotrys elegans]|uniref:Uncharacterized protein n=1 Tax=Stachybotrys elegans TaxID=80388 RepID=A0A8K0SNF1_9HYPO|nr:hypothetical protein B0I35DRAFT_440236 [Stachybotrys elegans]